MDERPLDPRLVANLMLDEADHKRFAITNLALQKLLYFAHGHHLMRTRQPLVTGYFEAWKLGPVHPAAYRAFKAAMNQPIWFRAEKRDPITGCGIPFESNASPDQHRLIEWVAASYGGMSASRLVEIAHAPKAPWAMVVDSHRTSMALGMRITEDKILCGFQNHKVSLGSDLSAGDSIEDTPFT